MASKLTEITSKYHTFVDNQVLTNDQLNEFITYFDDQDRLSRVFLNGVGIVCGFKLSYNANSITISQGVGVTTDGDLIQLKTDIAKSQLKKLVKESLTFTHFKKFKDDAATYPRFRRLKGTKELTPRLIDLYEIHPAKVENSKPLSSLNGLKNMAVLLYLESFADEGDLCTAIDCDNQGIAQINRLKVLLLSKSDAAYLASIDEVYTNNNHFESYFKLPEIAVKRVVLNKVNTSKYEELKRAYFDAIKGEKVVSKNNTVSRLSQAVELLITNFGSVLQLDIPKSRISTILSKLNAHFAFSAYNVPFDIQYRYDLLKDLVDTYNELKELLLKLKQLCLPDITAFPKHLMLGLLSEINNDPKDLRHDFYPSPAAGCNCDQFDEARSLLLKLFELIDNYDINAEVTRITPSNKLPELSKRSIPFYFNIGTDFLKFWDYSKTIRFSQNHNLSYHVGKLASSPQVQDPLSYNTDTFDFYRIEGHQGKDYRDVLENLDDLKQQYGLSFDVKALSVNIKTDDLNIDDYECEFEDLKVMLQAWTKEQDCVLAEVASFFSGFSTKEPGANIKEAELDLKRVEAAEKNSKEAAVSSLYQPAYSRYLIGTATKTLYQEVEKGKVVEENISKADNTIGVEMYKAIQETKGGSVNDIIANASKKLEEKVNTEEWNAEPELKEFVVNNSVELMAHTYVLTQRMPAAVNLVDVSRVNDYKLSLTQLCSLVKKLKAKYQSTKLSVGLQAFTGLLINQLSTVCCSGKKLEVLLDEVNERKEQILVRLQLSKFIEQHPGLEHKAGVEPGGTFILVYKNSERVVEEKEEVREVASGKQILATEALSASKMLLVDNILNLEKLDSVERSTVLKSATELMKYEDYTARIKEIETLEKVIPASQIPDNTVIADFALPYMCCSDCAPINYIISKPPATLRLSRNRYCLNTDTDPILYEVSPADGTIALDPDISGVSIVNGKLVIVAENFPEEMFGKTIHFTVNNQVTDAVLTVYKGINADFNYPVEPTDQATQRFVPSGDMDGASFFWEFGDGATSTEQNPSHTYKLPVNEKNSVTVRLTVTAENKICKTTVEHPITFIEQETEIGITPTSFCANDKQEYPFKVVPENAKVEISAEAGVVKSETGYFFVPAAAKTGANKIMLNGDDSGLIITVELPPVAGCAPKQVGNQLIITNTSKNANKFNWVINGSKQQTTNLNPITINLKPDSPTEWKIVLVANGAEVCAADRMTTSISTKFIEEPPQNTCIEEAMAAIRNDAKILASIKPDETGVLAELLNRTRNIYGGTSEFSKGVLDRLDAFLNGEANGLLESMFAKLLQDTGMMIAEMVNQPKVQQQTILLFELQLRLFYNILGCQPNEVLKKFADIISSLLNQIIDLLNMLQEWKVIFSDAMKKYISAYMKKVGDMLLLADHLKIITENKLI